MPTYEYRCSGCHGTVERWQSFNDQPLTLCPTCGGSLRRVFSAAPVIFKGSGWYCTDNRPKAQPESESSSPKSEPAGAAA